MIESFNIKTGLLLGLSFLGLASSGLLAQSHTNDLPSSPRFNEDIRPILSENCFKCHGPDDGARKGKLRLDVRDEALKPAKSGQVPIMPRAPEKSELIARVTSSDDDERMPPMKSGKTLTS